MVIDSAGCLLRQIKCFRLKTISSVESASLRRAALLKTVEVNVPQKNRSSARSAADRSESTEDHLERIQELVDRKGYARVTDIAAALGLSRSAVSNMVRRLAARGFVNYERYRGFTLTPAGRKVADHIKARHETLTRLLELMGLDSETIQAEVEGIEHHLRPRTLAVFERLVCFWEKHPEHLALFMRSRTNGEE